jgi:peptidoglycan hydrolase-like protein with peptidoglycan-binding domain
MLDLRATGRIHTTVASLATAMILLGCPHARTVEPPQEIEEEPTSIFRPEAIRKLQDVLVREGYEIERTGELDDRTQQALRSYQRKNGMVETGLPDQQTLRRLGLDLDDIYQRSPDPGGSIPTHPSK